jgi:hypothetical protein
MLWKDLTLCDIITPCHENLALPPSSQNISLSHDLFELVFDNISLGSKVLVDGVKVNGVWTTIVGSESIDFSSFPGFDGDGKCKNNSVLVWSPQQNAKQNPNGTLSCKSANRTACGFCRTNLQGSIINAKY